MTLRLKVRISQILLLAVAFLVCGPAGTPGALGQRLPSATERERKNKPAPSRREGRLKSQPAPAAPKNPVSVESGNFLALGNDFRKNKKWKAAEAAFKEAINVWPANADAVLELGFLYLDRNRIDQAQQEHGKLRSLNPSYAADLLAEINRRKAALAH